MKWTARKAVADLRERIEDKGANSFADDGELLNVFDQTVARVFEMARRAVPDYELSELTFDASTLSVDANDSKARSLSLSEDVVEVRYVEGQWADGQVFPLRNARKPLRHIVEPAMWGWQGGRPGKLYLYGNPLQFQLIRVFYKKSWPPMHFGVTDSLAPSDTTFRFAASPTGVLVNRANLYNDMDVAVESGPDADQFRRITTYTGGANREGTVDAAWSAAVASGTTYSLVIPFDWHHRFYILDEAEQICFRQLGELRINPDLRMARDDFLASVRSSRGTNYVYRK